MLWRWSRNGELDPSQSGTEGKPRQADFDSGVAFCLLGNSACITPYYLYRVVHGMLVLLQIRKKQELWNGTP